VRLLHAELTKLRRPLVWWITIAAILTSLAFAWQGAKNASAAGHTSATPIRPPACQDFALPAGSLCDRAIAVQEQIDAYHQRQAANQPSTRHSARPSDALPVEQPLASGKLAVGFMASLGGALLVFMLAASHLGNEWDRRTIKTLLCQTGTRWKVVAAKAASVWIVAMAITGLDWAALAAISPLLKAAYPLPGPGLSWAGAWTAIAADIARTPLILAVFTLLGITAAVVVRNALGAFALAAGTLLASLAAAGNLAAIAPWTLAYWVSGWMQFRSHGYVIYHFWVDGYPHGVSTPTVLAGIAGLGAVTLLGAAASTAVFRRTEITT
jgi:ABC-type transport system involved in multi-copper enzyme maturation permease subunit